MGYVTPGDNPLDRQKWPFATWCQPRRWSITCEVQCEEEAGWGKANGGFEWSECSIQVPEYSGRDFLVVQLLRLQPSTVEGVGSIPGGGTRVSHAAHCAPKLKTTTTTKYSGKRKSSCQGILQELSRKSNVHWLWIQNWELVLRWPPKAFQLAQTILCYLGEWESTSEYIK